jgi:hypothetical protein
VLTTSVEKAAQLLSHFERQGVPARQIGTVGGSDLAVRVSGLASREFKWPVAALYRTWDGALDSYLS